MKPPYSVRRTNARRAGTAEYEQKRDHLLECAAKVFKDFGYGSANVDDIAKEAGIDRATLYYYYKGKKEIFRDVIQRANVENVLLAESIASNSDRPEKKVMDLIRGLLASYAKHYPYLYIFVQEDMTKLMREKNAWSRDLQALTRRFDRAIVAIVQSGLDDGSFKFSGDARILASGLIGMCNWSHRWFKPSKYDMEKVISAFSEIALRGLMK